jgi:hypothetical protein
MMHACHSSLGYGITGRLPVGYVNLMPPSRLFGQKGFRTFQRSSVACLGAVIGIQFVPLGYRYHYWGRAYLLCNVRSTIIYYSVATIPHVLE